MDVVGHHAPRVDGHARRGGVASEDVDSGGGHGRTGEDCARPFMAMVIEQITPTGIGLRREPDASPLRVLFGHEPLNGLAADGGGQAPALQTDGGGQAPALQTDGAWDKPLPYSARERRKLG